MAPGERPADDLGGGRLTEAQQLEALVRLLRPYMRILDRPLSDHGITIVLVARVKTVEGKAVMQGMVPCDRFTREGARLRGARLLLLRSGQLLRQVRKGTLGVNDVGTWRATTSTTTIHEAAAAYPLQEIKGEIRAAIVRALASRAEARRKLEKLLDSPELKS